MPETPSPPDFLDGAKVLPELADANWLVISKRSEGADEKTLRSMVYTEARHRKRLGILARLMTKLGTLSKEREKDELIAWMSAVKVAQGRRSDPSR